MKRLHIFIFLVSFLGCSHLQKAYVALRGDPFPEDPLSASRGKVVYERECAGCHGLSGRGEGPDAESLMVSLPDFTDSSYSKSLSLLAANVTYGKREHMPAFQERLSELEIWDVSRYVYSFR